MPNPKTQTEAPEKKVRRYEGADWVRSFLKYREPQKMLSEFGERVADLLGDVYLGIYHIPEAQLAKVEWDNTRCLSLLISREFATYDGDDLTKLVILAHDRSIRVAIRAKTPRFVELLFHPREHGAKEFFKRHPTLEEAIKHCREHFGSI